MFVWFQRVCRVVLIHTGEQGVTPRLRTWQGGHPRRWYPIRETTRVVTWCAAVLYLWGLMKFIRLRFRTILLLYHHLYCTVSQNSDLSLGNRKFELEKRNMHFNVEFVMRQKPKRTVLSEVVCLQYGHINVCSILGACSLLKIWATPAKQAVSSLSNHLVTLTSKRSVNLKRSSFVFHLNS